MTKGLFDMKKILGLVLLAGVIGLVGCEDKKTSPPASSGGKMTSGATPSTGAVGSSSKP
jgi:hypothetical protein